MTERHQKLKKKLDYFKSQPDSYYLNKAELYGYKETPKCYKKDGKLKKKDNLSHMREVVWCIRAEIVEKGRIAMANLEKEWERLYFPPQVLFPREGIHTIPPNVEYESITGFKRTYYYDVKVIYPDGSQLWHPTRL